MASVAVAGVLLAGAACRSSSQTRYLHPNADLAAIQRVAVLPFENVTSDRAAADKLQKVFLVELLSLEIFDVAEPGQVVQALRSYKEGPESLTPADIKKIGETLNVQGVFIGTVIDFAESRRGGNTAPEITIQMRLVETQSGATVWSTSQSRSGTSVSQRLFGIGGQSLTEAARNIVRAQLRTLLQ
jgi:TolB-like protein